MSSLLGKRKLPRRELPWIGTLLDRLPYSKMPTNATVLRRLMFEMEQNNGTNSIADASLLVKSELRGLWEYAGYGDILKTSGDIVKQIKALRATHQDLCKTPAERRGREYFKKKEAAFLSSLGGLFDITVKKLRTSHLITEDDRDFLLNNWNKVISSTRDMAARSSVQKKLAREDKYRKFAEAQSSPVPGPSIAEDVDNSPLSGDSSGEEFIATPKQR